MKTVRRFLIAAMMITGLAAGCDNAPAVEPMPVLHAQGRVIVDADDNEVVLRGVNLGGWLFNETWITQIDYALLSRIHVMAQDETFAATVDELLKIKSDEWQGASFLQELETALAAEVGASAAAAFVDKVKPYAATVHDDSDLPLRRKLLERFGDDARDELLDIFQEAWLTEEDIAWIADQGFNLVRVPMSYRNLVTGSDLDKPTKLSSILSSLRVGFQTLAIEKRSHEVWTVLGAVKTEFDRFGEFLDKVQKQINAASKTLESAGTRTKQMKRKLAGVQALPASDAAQILALTEGDGDVAIEDGDEFENSVS